MNTRKWSRKAPVALAVLMVLALAVGLSHAQAPGSEVKSDEESGVDEIAGVYNIIPIQGRLTDASDNPIDGTRLITFTLYDQSTGGTALCQDDDLLNVDNGLFTAYMNNCTSGDIDGKRLYLGIQVEGDEEMTPRRAIYPVPYAFSLRPGAMIRDTLGSYILSVQNLGSGPALTVLSDSGKGVNVLTVSGNGVDVISNSGDGVVGTSIGGSGVVGDSSSGAAIDARGNGIIRSTAKSYVWISGNDLQKKNSTDTTGFECDTYGGVKITRGADPGNKDVMLPVTLPGQLYGQNVTLTGIDVYFESESEFDAIVITAVRRQTGAGSGDLIRWDDTPRFCNPACSYHLDLTINNVLDDVHGVVYIAFQLQFSGASTYLQIGGVRLTLEHD